MRGLGIILLALIAVGYTLANPIAPAAPNKLVCYYGSWAVYRPDQGKFDVENIDPFLCTHIIYGFVGLTYDGLLNVLDPYNDLEENFGKGAMKRFTGLKSQNPDLKVLLAIGGWNEGSEKYSAMVATQASRSRFIASVIPFLESQNFDGFDLDWEYPAARGGKPEDKENFDLLLAEMRAAFDSHSPRYLLTAAVSAGEATMVEAYNVPTLARYLDFINVMTYDFHGFFEGHLYTHHHAPMYEYSEDSVYNYTTFNVDYAIKTWNRLGAPYDKLVLGMGTYGRGFIVDNGDNHGIYAPAANPIPAGPYTRQVGILGYNEICVNLQQGQWEITVDQALAAPYAYNPSTRHWIGYDDVASIRAKAEYAVANGLGGGMIWSLETDDFHGTCGGESNPLIKTVKRTLNL